VDMSNKVDKSRMHKSRKVEKLDKSRQYSSMALTNIDKNHTGIGNRHVSSLGFVLILWDLIRGIKNG